MSLQPRPIPTGSLAQQLFISISDLGREVEGVVRASGQANALNGAQITAGTIAGTSLAANTITAGLLAAGAVTAGSISAGSVTTAALAAGSVTAAIISAGAVNATHIQAGSIGTNELAANAVTAGKIAANTITAGEISAGAITTTTLAAGAVTTQILAAGAVTSVKVNVVNLAAISGDLGAITAGTVTGATLQTGTTGSRIVIDTLGIRGFALNGTTKVFEIATGTGIASFTGVATLDALSVVPGGTLVASSVTDAKIAGMAAAKVTGQLTNAQIADLAAAKVTGQIVGTQITDNSITTIKIAALAVTASQIAADTITAGQIAANAITSSELSAGAVIAGKITAGTIVTADLAAGGVNADRLVAGSIQTLQLAAGSITANTIAAGAVQVQHLSVSFGGANILKNAAFSYYTGIAGGAGVTQAYITNNLPNPSFEVNVVGWNAYQTGQTATLARAAAASFVGTAVARVAATQAAGGTCGIYSDTPVADEFAVGQVVTISFYSKAVSTARTITPKIDWYTTAGVFISSSSGVAAASTTTGWTRFSCTATAPATAVRAGVTAVISGAALNEVHDFDAFMKVFGTTSPDYFDGSTPGASWTGTAHSSISTLPDSPGYWMHYEDPGTGGAIWFKVLNGGPNGENSWKINYVGTNTRKGFVSNSPISPRFSGRTYVLSFYWRGNALPNIANNTAITVTTIAAPAVSATTWQRYIYKIVPTANGLWDVNGTNTGSGGYDYMYLYGAIPGSGTTNLVQIELADIQYEEGEVASTFSVASSEVLPGSVGNTQIAPDSITTDKILARTILASDIATGTLTANEILARTITAGEIAVGAITANEISTGTITGTQLSFNAIDGKTITGGLVRTAATGARVELSNTGIQQYDSIGTLKVNIPSSGADATFTGHLDCLGIDFLAAITSTPPADRKIRWHKDTLGSSTITGELYSFWSTTSGTMGLAGASPDGTKQSFLQLDTDNTSGTNRSSLYASIPGAGGIKTILDGTGASSFLQLYGQPLLRRRMNFGSQAFVCNGTGQQQVVIFHSLGVVPALVIPVCSNNNTAPIYRVFNLSTTQATVEVLYNVRGGFNAADSIPPSGTNDGFNWLAIG